MKKITDFAKRLWIDNSGQGMVEYGLILALIAVVLITILTALGTNIGAKYQEISDALS